MKLRGSYKDFPCIPCPNSRIASHYQIPLQSGIFVITDQPTLTHPHYPKAIVYIKILFSVVHCMDKNKCKACVHHYSIIQYRLTILKILSAPPVHPVLPSKLRKSLIFMLSLWFYLFQNVI